MCKCTYNAEIIYERFVICNITENNVQCLQPLIGCEEVVSTSRVNFMRNDGTEWSAGVSWSDQNQNETQNEGDVVRPPLFI